MESNNQLGGPMIPVVITIVIGIFIVKIVSQILVELSSAMLNFGKMMGSFVFMLWNTFEVLSLVAMILFVTVGGVYFVIRYMKSVRELADNREWLTQRLEEMELAAKDREQQFVGTLHRRITDLDSFVSRLDGRLQAALKKPEVAPVKAPDVPVGEPTSVPSEPAVTVSQPY